MFSRELNSSEETVENRAHMGNIQPQGWFDPWTQCLNMALQEHYDEKDTILENFSDTAFTMHFLSTGRPAHTAQYTILTLLEEKVAFLFF